MKKALAVISFGTTHPDARQSIARIERASVVRSRIAAAEGLKVPGPDELMEQLSAAGYDEVCCQSLHVMPGLEYEKMYRELIPFRGRFRCFTLGQPLLASPEDCRAVCEGLLISLPDCAPEEAYVYMGHGTEIGRASCRERV